MIEIAIELALSTCEETTQARAAALQKNRTTSTGPRVSTDSEDTCPTQDIRFLSSSRTCLIS